MAKKAKVSQPPFYLLSLDPAADAGYCLFKAGKPFLWGPMDGTTWKSMYTALLDAHNYIAETYRDPSKTAECVIEEGFFQYGKSTFKGALTLGRRRGLAQAAAEAIGLEKFTFHVPSTWQNGLGWRKESGMSTKEWSLALVKERWGITGITHDVADAIALGTYHLDNYQALA